MIKRIEIKNFKNIGNQSVDLHPYINSFVGENGSGKSSIIFKAPRLVLQNENWPVSKIKSGESSSSISIQTSKSTIKRERTKTTTKIIIDGIEYDGKKNVQGDIESLGFYNTTKLGKNVDLHFLKSNDILDFMPKSPESFYLKLSTIFNFNRIIDLKKEYTVTGKNLSKDIQSTTAQKEECATNIGKIDAEVLSLRTQLILVEEIEELKAQIIVLNKVQKKAIELGSFSKENLKLKTTKVLENILQVLGEIKEENLSLLVNTSKKEILNTLLTLNKLLDSYSKVLKTNKTLINLLSQQSLLTDKYNSLPRCSECNRVL